LGAAATSSITAKATAGLVGTVSSKCVYVLNPSAQNAFQATNGSAVTLNGCGLAIDSTNADAMTVSGGSTVTASAISIAGGDVISGGSSTTPAPVVQPPAVDPFASLPAPAVGACNFTDYSPGWGSWTLNPGVYCGDSSHPAINLSNGSTAVFNPGIYIIKGGGVSLTNATDTGNGVMFYLTGTNASYGSVTISNGAAATLSAPPSGAYMGVLFYQDRSITSSNNGSFAGGVNMLLTGTLYFPTTGIVVSNGAGSNSVMGIVAAEVSFSGGAKVTWDSTGQKTGLFSKSVALVQ
jgi:hypothetical protein